MGSKRLDPRPLPIALRRARRRVVWTQRGIGLAFMAFFVAGLVLGVDAMPIGVVPALMIMMSLYSLLAPHGRRVAWLARARGDLSAFAGDTAQSRVQAALREARTRRNLLLFYAVLSLLALLLGGRSPFAPPGQILPILALVLLALWRAVVDVRQLARVRSCSPGALRQVFS